MSIIGAETIGTALLILFGDGVVAAVLLNKSKVQNADWIVIALGWGFAVMVGVYAVGQFSGAHLNPAVTVGLWISGATEGSDVPKYFVGEFLGAAIGAFLVFLAYYQHFGETEDPGLKLAVFSTGPAIRNPFWNTMTEVIGTFALVFGVLAFGNNAAPGESRAGRVARRLPGCGHRPVAWRSDRVRHQPRSRPEPAHHARDPAHPGQGHVGLGLLLGSGGRAADRRRARRGGVLVVVALIRPSGSRPSKGR